MYFFLKFVEDHNYKEFSKSKCQIFISLLRLRDFDNFCDFKIVRVKKGDGEGRNCVELITNQTDSGRSCYKSVDLGSFFQRWTRRRSNIRME